MSVESTVLFGYLITGRVTSDLDDIPHRQCSGSADHSISRGDFCPVCGSPVVEVKQATLVKRSFNHLFTDSENQFAWCAHVSQRARDFVTNTFAFTGIEEEDGDEETLFYLEGCVEVDGVETAVTPVDIKKLKAPSKRALNTLRDVMGYEHINVRLGIAVIATW